MPSSVSISLVIFVWITTIIIINHASTTVAKTQSSSLDQELKVLNQTRWYNREASPRACQWYGAICNDVGSVVEVNVSYEQTYTSIFNFSYFNFSLIPNLVRFKVVEVELEGTIPPEIGSVSKLTHLNLSRNFLSGELPRSLTKLTQLEKLDISFNRMSGPIP